jgi:kynureninase
MAALDAVDPLAGARERFVLPEGTIYLDGNSLGALPRAAKERAQAVVAREWGEGLIRSWNDAGWIDLPRKVAGKIARLIGAEADEVLVTDSTSINLFKLLAAALGLRRERSVILTEESNFPTDLYVAQGLARWLGGGCEVRAVPRAALADALDDRVAVVMLTEVDYRTGELHDMAAITKRAQAIGALSLWDLSHSAGALPVDLKGAHVDLAVGCGYKYLNGGPGAPAFLYVARRWHESIEPVVAGWMGHARPFAFESEYAAAGGIARLLTGTPSVIPLSILDAALDVFDGIAMQSVRAKSISLTSALIELVDSEGADHDIVLASPREPERRGSQVSFRHPHGYPIMQALAARGVIGDFRAPDIMRFGVAPMYVRHVDIWDAVNALCDVLVTGEWRAPRFARVAAVT